MASSPRSILLVRLGAVGDVVHGLPLACRLRHGFPGCRIGWAVGPMAAPLLRGHPAIDEVIVLHKRAPRAFWRGARALRAPPRRYEVAIDLQGLAMSALVSWLAGVPRRLSFDRGRTREGAWLFYSERIATAPADGPIIGQNLAFADHLGAPPAPLRFDLRADERGRARAAALLGDLDGRRVCALIVGAGKPANRPAPETLAGAARALAREGFAIILLGGARDAAEADAIAADVGEGARSLVGRTGLMETLAVLERASVAIGGDTGPLHMAAAAGAPVVAIFGGANPARTGPVGLAATRVVCRRWACAPCHRRVCPTDRGCLTSIEGEEVARAALEIAAAGAPDPRGGP